MQTGQHPNFTQLTNNPAGILIPGGTPRENDPYLKFVFVSSIYKDFLAEIEREKMRDRGEGGYCVRLSVPYSRPIP